MQVPTSERPGPVPPLRLAHLVNVFVPAAGSEFEWVLPITLETMRRARVAATTNVHVELLTAQFSEDRSAVPDDFRATPDLESPRLEVSPRRPAAGLSTARLRRNLDSSSLPRLPLIADLLQHLYESTDAEWLIYTNADIALQPRFYDAVASFIRAGHDAFIINRRRIPGHYRSIAELPAMYAEKGKAHPGFDCFVFHRDLFPKFRLGEVCIGIPFIEILMGQNLFCHARNFKLYDREFLTFHIGEEVFKKRNPYLLDKNRSEFWSVIEELWPHLDSRKFPWGDRWLPLRLIKWGLHPCIPIRLALRLEKQRFIGKRK